MFEIRSPLPIGRSAFAALTAVAALAGCASISPGTLPPGTPIAQARQGLFKPTGEYALAGGGTRLEFAHGGYSKQTYMLDFDRDGKLVESQQVLTEPNLATIAPGITLDELRMRFGHPVWVFGIRGHRSVWNYRYAGGDCVWWQVTIDNDTHQVTEAGVGPDPACDRDSDGRQ